MTSCHGDRRKSGQGPQAAGLPLRLLLAHVSSHTATQDRHGHTPRHCWHTTHPLGSTEHPPFACSRTTQHSSQPPQSTLRSAYTTPHQWATQCEYAGKALKRKHISSLSCKPTAHPRRPPHSIHMLAVKQHCILGVCAYRCISYE